MIVKVTWSSSTWFKRLGCNKASNQQNINQPTNQNQPKPTCNPSKWFNCNDAFNPPTNKNQPVTPPHGLKGWLDTPLDPNASAPESGLGWFRVQPVIFQDKSPDKQFNCLSGQHQIIRIHSTCCEKAWFPLPCEMSCIENIKESPRNCYNLTKGSHLNHSWQKQLELRNGGKLAWE